MLICGIDEAGKGSVAGSLFIAGAVFEEEDVAELQEKGVRDSKLLIHKKREQLRNYIEKKAKKWKVIQVKPKEIDEAVDGDNALNLNWLEAVKIAELINNLKPDMAIVDCPSVNVEKYTAYLKKLLDNKNIKLVIEHKADENYFPCAAASILAKCARENEVRDIEKKVGESIGSGYPSNPVCQKFLKDNLEKYPELFRHSWKTVKKHKTSKGQKGLGDF